MTGNRKYILLIILIILAIYSNSFRNEFVWDDQFLIAKNPSIMSWNYAWVHFALDLYHSFSNYYRPAQMITYMLDFSLWRLDPFGYHLTNILLHIFTALSLFMLLKLMTEDGRMAFIGTLFYAVHPAHTAAVTYIAGRADPLAAFFMLLSLILFHRHFKARNKHGMILLYFCSLFSFLLALLSKEAALILPAVILPYRLFFISNDEAKRRRSAVKFHYMSGFIIILAVYLILRVSALNFLESGILESRHALYSRLLTSLKAIGIYFEIIFLPFNLRMERSIPYALTFLEKEVMLSAMLIFFVFWLALRVRKVSETAFFGLLFFFISLLPVMNIFPMNSNLAEHWLYVPMMGISVFLSSLGLKLWTRRKSLRPFLALFMVCWLSFFSYKTFDRNFDWRDAQAIYTHTLNYNPVSIKMLNNLGNLEYAKGDFDRAIILHKKAVRINPAGYKTRLNLGIDYEALGMLDKALAQYKKSVLLKPDYAKAYFNIGNVYVKKKRHDMAVAAYQSAIRHDDFHIGARTNLGNVYFDNRLFELAKHEYLEVIRVNPYLPDAHNNLGNALKELGLRGEAVEEYEKAIELAPEEAEYHFNMGAVYGELGRYDEALSELKEAHRLRPMHVETLINLGAGYFHKGDIDSAKREWEKALRIEPENTPALRYLKRIRK